MKKIFLGAWLVLILPCFSPGADLYWNGAAGTWDTTTANWGTSPSGPFNQVWVNATTNTASFSGSASYTVTDGVNITLNKLTNTATGGTLTFAGSQITFGGTTPMVHVTTKVAFTAPLKGTGVTLTKTGGGELQLNNNAQTIAKYVLNGGIITTANTNKWGTANAADALTLNGAGWGINSGSQFPDSRIGIVLGAGGGSIGCSAATIGLVIGGKITGAGGITIGGSVMANTGFTSYRGAGTNMFLNTANDYAGSTTITDGSLALGASGVIPDGSAVTVNTGASLLLNGQTETVGAVTLAGGTISGGGSLTGSSYALQSGTISGIIAGSGAATKTTSGTATLSGANTFSGGLTLSAGTLAVGNAAAAGTGPLALNGGTIQTSSTTGRTLANAVTLGGDVTFGSTAALTFSGAATLTGSRTLTVNNTNTFSNTISEDVAGRSITKEGTGTLVLSGTNTFSGGVTVNAGVLRVGANGALGTGALTLANGVTLAGNNSTGRTLNNAVNLNGDLNLGQAAGGTGGLTLTANIDLGGVSRTLSTEGNAHTLSGILSNGGLVKSGSGTLTLSGDNTFSGGVAINAGRINFNHANAAGTGAITVNAGSTIGGTAAGITMANNVTLGGGGTVNAIVTSGNSLTLAGTVSGGNAGGTTLTKTNTGTLTLTGNNTYVGDTVVDGGKLIVNNTSGSGTGSGNVIVNTNGTVGGSGTISGTVILNSGATVAAGNSPGHLTTGSQTWAGGATNQFEINDVNGTAGSDPGWDLITINGDLTINANAGNKFVIDVTSLTSLNAPGQANGFDNETSYAWNIAAISGNILGNGFDPSFFDIQTGNFVGDGGPLGTFALGLNAGNLTLSYAAIPEPSTIALGVLGAVAFGVNRIRRRK